MKHQSYMTRAMQAGDRRFARIFDKLGYDTKGVQDDAPEAPPPSPPPPPPPPPPSPAAGDEIAALRAEYAKVIGKKPFNGWDAATLTTKIAEKRAAG